MANCVMPKKDMGLYEEPTTYRYDYVLHPLTLEEKIPKSAQISTTINDTRYLDSSQKIVRAHDTLQCLSYNKKIPFNTFWEPKDSISISLKPLVKQRILGDLHYQEAIRSRPRVYMTPGISLDDIQSPETRKLLVNFTYMTTSNYACNSVWHDFQPRHPCHTEMDMKKTCEKSIQRSPCILSARFQTEAHTWDKLQDRSLSVDDTFVWKNVRSKINEEYSDPKDNDKEKESDQIKIQHLLEKNKLRIAYDKFPLTYGGYRPCTGLGIPLEKKILPVVHPDLSVSQALFQRRANNSTC
ncbi:hypothetical protein KPH14_003452 [Odynerus spinipes]|uniref:Uncharacterized protein n=1 Tax=Odynerus spinipes TaxID=1348599 RepID=A0AAD9VKR7_9HYME|nr:hypothetical protein KPH14_003452 [Odynerus spinipes]